MKAAAAALVRALWAELTFKSLALPSILLAMLALAHIAPDVIGSFYPKDVQVRAATTWQFVLRAFESTLLYLIVWLLTPWRPVVPRIAVSAVCAWAATESFMIAACRLQFPMDRPAPKTELYTGLCDKATGLPIYMLTIAILLVMLVVPFVVRKRSGI